MRVELLQMGKTSSETRGLIVAVIIETFMSNYLYPKCHYFDHQSLRHSYCHYRSKHKVPN